MLFAPNAGRESKKYCTLFLPGARIQIDPRAFVRSFFWGELLDCVCFVFFGMDSSKMFTFYGVDSWKTNRSVGELRVVLMQLLQRKLLFGVCSMFIECVTI